MGELKPFFSEKLKEDISSMETLPAKDSDTFFINSNF